MSLEKSIQVINNEWADMLAAYEKTNKYVQQVGAAIEESKGHQALAASATQRLQELNENLLQIEAKEQAIITNIQAYDITSDALLLQMLADKFNKLDCNLSVSRDADNMTLYKFSYRSNCHIIVRVEYGQLELIEMCPENPNFKRLKQFLSETQDLNGLLANFASVICAAK